MYTQTSQDGYPVHSFSFRSFHSDAPVSEILSIMRGSLPTHPYTTTYIGRNFDFGYTSDGFRVEGYRVDLYNRTTQAIGDVFSKAILKSLDPSQDLLDLSRDLDVPCSPLDIIPSSYNYDYVYNEREVEEIVAETLQLLNTDFSEYSYEAKRLFLSAIAEGFLETAESVYVSYEQGLLDNSIINKNLIGITNFANVIGLLMYATNKEMSIRVSNIGFIAQHEAEFNLLHKNPTSMAQFNKKLRLFRRFLIGYLSALPLQSSLSGDVLTSYVMPNHDVLNQSPHLHYSRFLELYSNSGENLLGKVSALRLQSRSKIDTNIDLESRLKSLQASFNKFTRCTRARNNNVIFGITPDIKDDFPFRDVTALRIIFPHEAFIEFSACQDNQDLTQESQDRIYAILQMLGLQFVGFTSLINLDGNSGRFKSINLLARLSDTGKIIQLQLLPVSSAEGAADTGLIRKQRIEVSPVTLGVSARGRPHTNINLILPRDNIMQQLTWQEILVLALECSSPNTEPIIALFNSCPGNSLVSLRFFNSPYEFIIAQLLKPVQVKNFYVNSKAVEQSALIPILKGINYETSFFLSVLAMMVLHGKDTIRRRLIGYLTRLIPIEKEILVSHLVYYLLSSRDENEAKYKFDDVYQSVAELTRNMGDKIREANRAFHNKPNHQNSPVYIDYIARRKGKVPHDDFDKFIELCIDCRVDDLQYEIRRVYRNILESSMRLAGHDKKKSPTHSRRKA